MHENKETFDRAKNYYSKAREIQEKSRWASFGFIQCAYLEKSELNAEEQKMAEYIISSCRREYFARKEQRTKTLCKQTEYLCTLFLNKSENYDALFNYVETHFGEVNDDMTIYSQFRKRNVPKPIFMDDMILLNDSKDHNGVIRKIYNTIKHDKA